MFEKSSATQSASVTPRYFSSPAKEAEVTLDPL